MPERSLEPNLTKPVPNRRSTKQEKRLRTLISRAKRGRNFAGFARNRPSLFILEVFAVITLLFTTLLALPISSNNGQWTDPATAFFTSTSAISGTGLVVVPSGDYWSLFGQIVLMILIQIGGLGVMTMASMVAFLMSRRLGLTTKILAGNDQKTSRFGELGSLIKIIFATMISLELIITALLMSKFISLHEDFFTALWHAFFFSVSSFNNAGFNISPVPFEILSSQWAITIPILLSIFMGSVGFPVILNIASAVKHRKLRLISLHTKIVLIMFLVLDVVILLWYFIFEWHNNVLFSDEILGNDSMHSSAMTFAALTTQTSGFGVIDASHLSAPSKLITEIWMFVGGAPASTCSGIKVTTVAILLLAVFAEFRGFDDITLFKKRLPYGALKIAVTILICGIIIVVGFSVILDIITDAPFEVVQFDVISAFANCGLTLGLTNYLNSAGMFVIGLLMFLGRLGTMTIVSAMFRENRTQHLRYPEENIIVA